MENITQEEAIDRIEQVYHAEYDPTNLAFDVYEQLATCESIAETAGEEQTRKGYPTLAQPTRETNKNVIAYGNGNGTYKRNVNSESTKRKIQVIAELRVCNYQTPPRTVARLLEELFADYHSKEGHLLYIAQHWTPRSINQVIAHINKQHKTGEQSIQNPAAYFTHLIKHRKKKKSMRKGGESS